MKAFSDGNQNATSSNSSRTMIWDNCGRVSDLQFENDYGGWGWVTKISSPVLLAIGTIGNIVGILLAKDYNKCGSQRTFLISLYVVSLLYL